MKSIRKFKFLIISSIATLALGAAIPAIVSCSDNTTPPAQLENNDEYLTLLNSGLDKLYNPKKDNNKPKDITNSFTINDSFKLLPASDYDESSSLVNSTLASEYGTDIGSNAYVYNPAFHLSDGIYENNKVGQKINTTFVFNNKDILFGNEIANKITSKYDIEAHTFIPNDTNPKSPELILEVCLKYEANPKTYYFSFSGFDDASLEANLDVYLNSMSGLLISWYLSNPLFQLKNGYQKYTYNIDNFFTIPNTIGQYFNRKILVDKSISTLTSDELKSIFINKFHSKDIINRLIRYVNEFNSFLTLSAIDTTNTNKIISNQNYKTIILTQKQIDNINIDCFDFIIKTDANTDLGRYGGNDFPPSYQLKFQTNSNYLWMKFNLSINKALNIQKTQTELDSLTLGSLRYNEGAKLYVVEKSSIQKTLKFNDQTFLQWLSSSIQQIYDDLIANHGYNSITTKKYELNGVNFQGINVNLILPRSIHEFVINPNKGGDSTSLVSIVSYLMDYCLVNNIDLEFAFDSKLLNLECENSKLVFSYNNSKKETVFYIKNNPPVVNANTPDEVLESYVKGLNEWLKNKNITKIELESNKLNQFISVPRIKVYDNFIDYDLNVSYYINDTLFKDDFSYNNSLIRNYKSDTYYGKEHIIIDVFGNKMNLKGSYYHAEWKQNKPYIHIFSYDQLNKQIMVNLDGISKPLNLKVVLV